jgi:hypothetical protein
MKKDLIKNNSFSKSFFDFLSPKTSYLNFFVKQKHETRFSLIFLFFAFSLSQISTLANIENSSLEKKLNIQINLNNEI